MGPRFPLQEGSEARGALRIYILFSVGLTTLLTKDSVLMIDGLVTKEPVVANLWYNATGAVVTYTIDYCDVVVPCPSVDWQTWIQRGQFYICVTSANSGYGSNCESWSDVGWNTGPAWGYEPEIARSRKDKNGRSLLTRMILTKSDSPNSCHTGTCMPLHLTILNPSLGDQGLYVLGAYSRGGGLGKFRLKVLPPSPPQTLVPKGPPVTHELYPDKTAMRTGFLDTNLWLEWMRYTSRSQGRTGCIACAVTRPHLGTVPLPFSDSVKGKACEKWERNEDVG